MEAKMTVTMTFDDYFQFKTTIDFFEKLKKTIEGKGKSNLTSADYALYDFVKAFLAMSKV